MTGQGFLCSHAGTKHLPVVDGAEKKLWQRQLQTSEVCTSPRKDLNLGFQMLIRAQRNNWLAFWVNQTSALQVFKA